MREFLEGRFSIGRFSIGRFSRDSFYRGDVSLWAVSLEVINLSRTKIKEFEYIFFFVLKWQLINLLVQGETAINSELLSRRKKSGAILMREYEK